MPLQQQFLIEQYHQCNEHLRESDKKRDLILGSYVTLSLAIYTFSPQKPGSDNFIIVLLGLAIVGILIGFLFTLYRGWHGIYVLQAILLQEIIHKETTHVDGESVKKIEFAFNYVTSVELFMFLILHLVVFMNAFLAVYLTPDFAWGIRAFGVVVIATLEFISHFLAMAYLDRLKQTGRLGTRYFWILQNTVDDWPKPRVNVQATDDAKRIAERLPKGPKKQ
jgi:hypothetical protein